jgi:hypothetical protein
MTPLSDEPVQKPFILNSKEERILQVGHELEIFTEKEIRYRLFAKGSRTHVGAILRKLCGGRDYDDQQFLYRFPLPTAAKGPKERVYCLGAGAREVLAIEDASRRFKFRYLSYSPILHDLALSRFLTVATIYFAAQTDYTLLETRTCYQLAHNPPRITVGSQGKETAITVNPDAWLYITRVSDGSEHALWIEIDRGTENYQRFTRLVRNRLAVVRSPQYEKMFNTKAILLCYVTVGTSEQADIRLHNMLRWTEDVLTEADELPLKEREQWTSLFRFATVDFEKMYDQAHALFTQPLWYKPDDPDPVPLFAPVNHPNQQETGHGQGETVTN